MKTYLFISVIAALFFSRPMFAQVDYTQLPGKIKQSIDNLATSNLITNLKRLRNEAESSVKMIKREQDKYSALELQKLELGFDNSALMINAIPLKIRNDFFDPKKRKYIKDYAESYQNELYGSYMRAKENYEEEFKKPLNQILAAKPKEEFGKGFPAADLLPIVGLVTSVIDIAAAIFDFFNANKQYVESLTEAYITEKIITPCKVHSWAEIEVEGLPMSYDNSNYPIDNRQRSPETIDRARTGLQNGSENIETLNARYKAREKIRQDSLAAQKARQNKINQNDDNPYNDNPPPGPGFGAGKATVPPKKNDLVN